MSAKDKIRVVGISGSLRIDSYNRKALQVAKQIAVNAGTEISEVDLKELNLPLYDGDIEARGFPESVEKLRDKVKSSDVLLIATPEYNHSISGALKNAIDWLSTTQNVLDGKSAVIFGVSTGLFGTMRGQLHLRQILTALNVWILPQPQIFIRSGKEAFNPDGSLKDQKIAEQLKHLITKSITATKAFK